MAKAKAKQNNKIAERNTVTIDWLEVGDLYASGMKTISELARYTGYSRGKVLKELKNNGFYKDNTKDIERLAKTKMATDGKFSTTTIRSGQYDVLSPKDQEKVIETEAERIAQVQLKQRHSIGMVMEELEHATILLRAERKIVQKVLSKDNEEYNVSGETMEELTSGELEMVDKSNKAQKLLTPSYIREELGKLSQAYAKVIPVERQLHGLDKKEDAPSEKEAKAKRQLSEQEMKDQVYNKLDEMIQNVNKKAGDNV
jgi:hypothetical protein